MFQIDAFGPTIAARAALAVALAAGAGAGCTGAEPPLDGGQIGAEDGTCEVVDTQPLGRDEVSALGFAAGAVLDYAAGEHADALVWAAGGSTPLVLTVTETADIAFLTREARSGDGGGTVATEMAPWCPNVVSMGVAVGLRTDDGAFDEAWDLELLADTADLASASVALDDVAGTFDPWDYAPDDADFDAVRAWLDVTFTAAGPYGAVSGLGEGTDGDTAYAQALPIATFGQVQE